jgi:hypothetical protein
MVEAMASNAAGDMAIRIMPAISERPATVASAAWGCAGGEASSSIAGKSGNELAAFNIGGRLWRRFWPAILEVGGRECHASRQFSLESLLAGRHDLIALCLAVLDTIANGNRISNPEMIGENLGADYELDSSL